MPSIHRQAMTRHEIIQKIEAYEAKEQNVRQRLAEASDPHLRAELQLMLRLITVVLFGLANDLKETLNIGTAGRPHRAAAGAQNRA
jgi:hypothetical protein